MSNTIYFNIDENQEDDNGTSFNELSYIIQTNFSNSVKSSAVLPSVDSYVVLSLGTITTANLIRISSDQELTIKFNGGSQEFSSCTELIFYGDITALSVKNFSGNDAVVYYEMYEQ